jgi:hypothetical protein
MIWRIKNEGSRWRSYLHIPFRGFEVKLTSRQYNISVDFVENRHENELISRIEESFASKMKIDIYVLGKSRNFYKYVQSAKLKFPAGKLWSWGEIENSFPLSNGNLTFFTGKLLKEQPGLKKFPPGIEEWIESLSMSSCEDAAPYIVPI